MIKFHKDFTLPTEPNSVFVFGSNLAGSHGAGSARFAADMYGAEPGIYFGRCGTRGEAYAIPTVDSAIEPLPIEIIQMYVDKLIRYSLEYSDTTFFVTRIGCGIAGFTDEQMSSLFYGWHTLHNFDLPEEWMQYLPDLLPSE